jgi:hypothetical protein
MTGYYLVRGMYWANRNKSLTRPLVITSLLDQHYKLILRSCQLTRTTFTRTDNSTSLKISCSLACLRSLYHLTARPRLLPFCCSFQSVIDAILPISMLISRQVKAGIRIPNKEHKNNIRVRVLFWPTITSTIHH